jgi:hypothetical protein
MPADWDRPPEPEFPDGAAWLWECWRDLDTERPMVGVGGLGAPPVPGRIPYSAVDLWARRHGVDGSEFAYLLRAISLMDSLLIEYLHSKGA